jgi:hypothetical protein
MFFPIRDFCRVTGLLETAAAVIAYGQWRVRPLHWFRKNTRDPLTALYEDGFLLGPDFLVKSAPSGNGSPILSKGVPPHDPPPDVVLHTNAPLEGWSARILDQKVSGLWTPQQ